jgi:hypothetical protein
MKNPVSPNQLNPESPWLGLRAFTEFAKDYFFGRDSELNDLNDRIMAKPLTILFGQSGLGKSSLVQAGLAPRFRSSGYLPIYIRFDHAFDAESIEEQLLDSLTLSLYSSGRGDIAERIAEFLIKNDGKFDKSSVLWLLFHDPSIGLISSKENTQERPVRLVFIIDQFEEIFTLGERKERKEISDRFRDTLAAMVENRPPTSLRKELENNDDLAEKIDYRTHASRFLLILREDFLHILERWKRSIPSMMSNRVELRMLNGPQAFMAVVRPGRLRVGKPAIISDEVGEAIVRFVAGQTDDVPLSQIDAVPPLLSLVCAELNEQRQATNELQITNAQFKGRSIDILEGFYDRSFALDSHDMQTHQPRDISRALKRAKQLIEDRLITPDGYRENISYESIAKDLLQDSDGEPISPSIAKSVLDGLVERRLLTVEERLGVRRVELTHDILTAIVKSSRDKRHDEESQQRLRILKEKAENEKAKIIKERNKLRRFSIISSCLAIMAIGAATMAFSWYRQAKKMAVEAEQAEAEAKEASLKKTQSEALAQKAEEEALRLFRLTRSGFSELYDQIVNSKLEQVPGINIEKTLDIKRQMREYLIGQLGSGLELQSRLKEDPKLIARQITRIHLDEGRDRILVKDFNKATESLKKAMESSRKTGLDSQEDAESRGDILLEETRALSNAEKRTEGAMLAKKSIEEVSVLADQWPNSWRLRFILIRLKNLINVGDEKSSAIYAQLYKSMIEIAEESNRQFDPVLWTFTLGANQQSNQGDDAESSADYSFALDLIRFFKTDIISNRRYSLLDKQEAAENFFTYIGELRDQLAKDSNPATIEKRRSVVEELENTVAEMEKVLRLSIPVYNIRNVLLEIQQAGFSQRINTIEYDRIAAARKQHRIIASHFGIGGSFVESFAKMVKDYVDSDSTEKENALLQVQQIAKDFETMDLKNAQIVMSDYRISSAIELLPAKDPVLEIYAALLDRYLFLYIEDSQQDVDLYFETLVNVCRDRISKWSSDGENEKLFEFYEVYLRNAVLTSRTQNDKSVLLEELRNIAIAAIKLDKPEIAEEIWSASNAICETIIQARPWDFYIHQAQFGLCFEAAKEWNALKNQENTQRWLRRGWESYRLFSGDSIDLASVAVLPQRGEKVENLDPDAQRFFDRLKPVSKGGVPNTVQSVPCDFSGKMFPLKTYVIPGKTSFQQLKNQLRWVDEYRGGKPDPTYVAIIDRLGAEANEMGLDFKTHFDRNFTKLLATEKNRSLLEVLSIEAMRRATGSTQDETILPKTLQIFESLIGSSIASSNWAQLEHQSRRLLSRDGSNKNASVALAFSLFAQERVADSISILKTDWPDNKGAIGNIVRAYVGNDERGTSFSRLYRIADENNVSFPDLMEYALSTEIEKERKKENRLEQATKAKEELSELSNINQSGNNDESIADASLRSSDLIGRLITIADRAMFAEDWDQAIEVSKDILNYKPDDLDAKSKLAISYMMNRQEALAQEIIDRIWDVFQENMSGAEHLLMYRNSIKAAGLNYNSSIIAGVSSHPDDLFSLQYGLDPDTSLHTIRLIVSNEDGKFQWFVFESKRGYDRKVADQISGYSPRFIAETWAWDKILVYGKFLQQGIDSSPPSVESILKGFSNPERLPEIRDALILNRSPSSEYFSAIWNLQRWQQRVKLIELNQKLSGYDEQIFNKQESDRQLKRRFNTASFKALFLERWDESEAWARKVLEIDPDYLYGLGNLANSFLYRGRYNEAIEIYREHWDKDDDGDSFGSFIVDDFERLKDAGITHPDTQRVLMELPTPKPRQP